MNILNENVYILERIRIIYKNRSLFLTEMLLNFINIVLLYPSKKRK